MNKIKHHFGSDNRQSKLLHVIPVKDFTYIKVKYLWNDEPKKEYKELWSYVQAKGLFEETINIAGDPLVLRYVEYIGFNMDKEQVTYDTTDILDIKITNTFRGFICEDE